MAIDEKKLKPCPFCGYHAVAESGKARKGFEAIVRCNSCGAEYQTVYFDTIEEAENDAIESWNKRTSDKWIPCSERLPEEKASEFSPHYTSSDVVLVSVYSKRYGYEIFKNFLLDGKWSCESQMSEYKVLAWMPLPEAYKGEEK